MSIKRFFGIGVFSFFVLFCILGLLFAKTNKKSASESVKTFLESLKKGPITRLEVFYFWWSADTMTNMTEDYLFKSEPGIKVAYQLPYFFTPDLKESLEALKYNRISQNDLSTPNFRVGYVFYAGKKESLRLTLARSYKPILSINGDLFEAEPKIVEALMEFLPVRAYEIMYKDLEKSGFFSENIKKEDAESGQL